MSEHHISLHWARGDGPFERGNYDSGHEVRFAGGQSVRNSAGSEDGGDGTPSTPEELLLAAPSSCHMLTFLAVAANRGWMVDDYRDAAIAYLGKGEDGKTRVTRAVLAPRVDFGGDRRPSHEDYVKMQERAHAACFIANSVLTRVELDL